MVDYVKLLIAKKGNQFVKKHTIELKITETDTSEYCEIMFGFCKPIQTCKYMVQQNNFRLSKLSKT